MFDLISRNDFLNMVEEIEETEYSQYDNRFSDMTEWDSDQAPDVQMLLLHNINRNGIYQLIKDYPESSHCSWTSILFSELAEHDRNQESSFTEE